MPRDIPVGNGQMLVTFDERYRIRDLYYPHVGQENHAGNGPSRFGVWTNLVDEKPKETSERRKQRLLWTDDPGWEIERKYVPDTLCTHVTLRHPRLGLELTCQDVIDFHRPVLVRRIDLRNLTDQTRDVSVVHHHDFNMYGTRVGDTAYYDPKLRSLVHYRKKRYILASFYHGSQHQIDQYATGNAGFNGAEGTWRDAEDGELGNNPIAQGAVDSTMLTRIQLEPGATRTIYMVLGCGKNMKHMQEIHRFLHRVGPQGVIDRTNAYWRLWLAASRAKFENDRAGALPDSVTELYKRSLLVVRTQIDNSGAIIAANDSDILQFSRDTYSYLWPRDGAFVADAMDAAGFPDVARSFFSFCSRTITDSGMFLHKYNPDGSPASSWHPWVVDGRPQLPIQEDETALVVWSLWRHFVRYRDIEFMRPLWVDVVQKAADFMVRYRDPDSRLPLPSYDLWEERWGVHAFTVATVYAGLKAAWQFAVCFGDTRRSTAYAQAAEEVKQAFSTYFWSKENGRFLRRMMPCDPDRTAQMIAQVMAGRTPESEDGFPADQSVAYEPDPVLDSSLYAIWAMGLLDPRDERVEATMNAIADELWIKTGVGGIARYTNDYYHQVSDDVKNVPGNPWFICTLWLADYYIARAETVSELEKAKPILDWVARHALPSGILAEQVHPHTNAPLSVSPLTWSHATLVATVTAYQTRLDRMSRCPSCGQPRLCLLPGLDRDGLEPLPDPDEVELAS
ncbi:MAG: glycoside hydrolase family 15 protein [Phycisphaeraceae bacterium]